MRILIADDDMIFREVLTRSLLLWGYEPEAVEDGDDAAQVLQSSNRPRLALLDWEMPGLDGLDLCRLNTQLNNPDPTYCILLTAHATPADTTRGLESGACDFIAKPMHHLMLRRRLAVWRRLVELETAHRAEPLGLEGP